jgi:hypothetical protein
MCMRDPSSFCGHRIANQTTKKKNKKKKQENMKLLKYTMFATTVLLPTQVVEAAVVVPSAVVASSQYDFGPGIDTRGALSTIDGSGLSGSGSILTQKHNGLADVVTGAGHMWLSNNVVTPTITFDLGSSQTIERLYIWNYAEDSGNGGGADETDRGVATFRLLADNSATPTTVIGGTLSLAKAVRVPGGTYNSLGYNELFNEGVQTITLGAPVTARYFTFDVLTNHGDSGFSGLSEVRFDTVPEVSSISILGTGLIGLMVRRRR